MTHAYRFAARTALVVLALLGACGGQGDKPADVFPSPAQPAPTPVAGPDSFLLFPNPQVQPDHSLQTNSVAYAEAYYKAIDPANAKTTLSDWKAQNNFDQPGGRQASAVFGDFRDLGYGRRMTSRQNLADNSVAFVVENYLVNPGANGYGASINVDAAVVQDRQWRVSINAIEFSADTPGGTKYAKFYSFDPVTGNRKLAQDLDGRGEKALPGACISCHGGRADRLTPQFPQLQDNVAVPPPPAPPPMLAPRGDTRGRLHALEVDALTFSTTPGFTRGEQQAEIKKMNRMVLCTYPLPAAGVDEEGCRPTASLNEWQGGAADLIRNAYAPGMTAATFAVPAPPFTPAAWAGTPSQAALYQNVIVPACRSCHLVRGTGQQSDIDFASAAKFDSFAERTKYLVYERGNMPLAKIIFDKFWASTMPEQLATYLTTINPALAPSRDSAGKLLAPGHPFADAGPDRRVHLGATRLTDAANLFASSFRWTIVSGSPTDARLSGADTATPTFTADPAAATQRYVLELVVGNGTLPSLPSRVTLYVNANGDPNPALLTFGDIKSLLAVAGCTGCHSPMLQPPTAFAALDEASLYNGVLSQVNFADIAGSPLLRKPSGRPSGDHHAFDFLNNGFDTSKKPGDPARANYDTLLNWILNGAKQ